MIYKRLIQSKPRYDITRTTCDICKRDIEKGERFEVSDVNIELRSGNHYPDCNATTRTGLDCCEECFLTKVKPLIEKEFGVTFYECDSEDYLERAEEDIEPAATAPDTHHSHKSA